jgi:fido (protein-threonine AMPylation protein)
MFMSRKRLMENLNELHIKILRFIHENAPVSSSEILRGVRTPIALATLKRALHSLMGASLIESEGKGRATRYRVIPRQLVLMPLDTEMYFRKEIDERKILDSYNHELIREVLNGIDLFTTREKEHLNALQRKFEENIKGLSNQQFKIEFEKLAIDLSWKSSQIEGNTYSLLETERLLKEQQKASGKSKEEATMLLNHKNALDFLLDHPDYLSSLSLAKLEELHSLLIQDLKVERNLRRRKVGITGTNYKPLDNEFQIRDAIQEMCHLINSKQNVFEKALLALVLISYIQPFEDGNKRTARIISNAILMNGKYCPISFRTVDSLDYKKAMLVFYEQNNISAFKQIFIEQFDFAVNTYF